MTSIGVEFVEGGDVEEEVESVNELLLTVKLLMTVKGLCDLLKPTHEEKSGGLLTWLRRDDKPILMSTIRPLHFPEPKARGLPGDEDLFKYRGTWGRYVSVCWQILTDIHSSRTTSYDEQADA